MSYTVTKFADGGKFLSVTWCQARCDESPLFHDTRYKESPLL